MGSGYKRLYEAAERENRLLTELSDAKGEMIEKLNIMVAAQQELIETLKKQVDELQDQLDQQSVQDHMAESEKA